MDSTHLVSYGDKIIETTVTAKASVAENWMINIRSTSIINRESTIIVGFNCKWRSHPVIRSLSGKIMTLQLCVNTKCLILQLPYMDNISQSIKNFLSDPNIVFVGIEVDESLMKLENEYGLYFGKKMDVRRLAELHFPNSFGGKPGLKALAYQLVQLRMWKAKGDCLKNLESRVLGIEQIMVVCIDAYVSYRIGHKLLKGT